MKITAKRIADLSVMKEAFDSTVCFDTHISEKDAYRLEHSPIRTQEYLIKMEGIPSFVSGHFCRHKIGCEHYVQTNRDDRISVDISKGSSLTYKGFTQKAFKEVFRYKDGMLYWKIKPYKSSVNIGDAAGSLDSLNRYVIQYRNKRMKRSVIIFIMHYGYRPPIVDHINRKTDDDRIENLRASTYQLNAMNTVKRTKNISMYKGVNKCGDKYSARIQFYGNKIYLGTFESVVDAALAYDIKALELYGDHAILNFPDKIEKTPDRLTPVTHTMKINAEALINLSRKRLCLKSHKDTVKIMSLIKREVKKVSPDLSLFMVPNCIYRGGLCSEGGSSCGKYFKIVDKYSYYFDIFAEEMDKKYG